MALLTFDEIVKGLMRAGVPRERAELAARGQLGAPEPVSRGGPAQRGHAVGSFVEPIELPLFIRTQHTAPIALPVVLVVTLPLPPMLTNSSKGRSRHWRALGKERAAYYDLCDMARGDRNFPAPPARPFERVQLRSQMVLGAAMDDDNAMARHKWPLDWLKRRRYLLDDRKKNIEWLAMPDQHVTRSATYRITLTLTVLP